MNIDAILDETRFHQSVCCAGVVLDYINEKDRSSVTFELFSNESSMSISMDSMESLKIFDLEDHPNILQKNSKEGLSMFGKFY